MHAVIRLVAVYIGLLLVWCANVYGGYHASTAVKSAHSIPHLNQNFQLIDNNGFHFTEEYVISLFVFPAFMLLLGLISIFIFCTLWLFRCICTYCCRCCKCLQCLPDVSKGSRMNEDQLQGLRQKIVSSRRMILGFFVGFIFLGILASQCTLIGNDYITRGIRKENQALGSAKDFFYEVSDYSGSINNNSIAIDNILQGDPCVTIYSEFVNNVFEVLDELESVSESIQDSVDNIADDISSGQDNLLYYGIHTKNVILYTCYASYMFLLLLFLGSILARNRMLTRLLCMFTVIIVLALTICVFVETIIVMFLGDICIDPAGNIASLFPAGEARDVINYYTTCEGTNPLGYQITNTSQYTDQLNDYYEQLTTTACPGDTNLIRVEPYLDDLTQDTLNLVGLTDCSTIYAAWNAGINQGLCEYLFNGLFALWIGQYMLSFSLFMSMCFGVVLYGFYGELWRVTEGNAWSYQPEVDDGCCGCNRYHRPAATHTGIVNANEVHVTSPNPLQADAVIVEEMALYEKGEQSIELAHMSATPSAPPQQHHMERDSSDTVKVCDSVDACEVHMTSSNPIQADADMIVDMEEKDESYPSDELANMPSEPLASEKDQVDESD